MRVFTGLFFLGAASLLHTVAATAVYAADMPKRKSGLWEMKMSSNQGSGEFVIQQCIDEASDDLMRRQAESASRMMPKGGKSAPKQQCSKQDVRREGNRVVMDAVCELDKTTATTHAVATGTFDSARANPGNSRGTS